MRHAAHGNRIAAFFVSGGQGDLQFASADDCIFEEQLVEIAQAKEEKRARVLRFELAVLPDHWSGVRCRH